MKSYEYILLKQVAWAKARGLRLIGSQGDRGRETYTETLNDNLYETLDNDVREMLSSGDGGELASSESAPSKMQALHSSSALGVNVFHYWKKRNLVSRIASVCGFQCDGVNAGFRCYRFAGLDATLPASPASLPRMSPGNVPCSLCCLSL